MATDTTTRCDELEATIRRRMAVVARMNVRGFDGRRAKDAGIADLDRLLDEYAEAKSQG